MGFAFRSTPIIYPSSFRDAPQGAGPESRDSGFDAHASPRNDVVSGCYAAAKAVRSNAGISRSGSLRRRDLFELGRLPFEQAAIDAARPSRQHGVSALLDDFTAI